MLNTILGTLSSGVAASTSSFESIATATASGSTNTITFSSIPSTYASLQIRIHAKDTAIGSYLEMIFNNDTASNYAYHSLTGNGSTASASGSATQGTIRNIGYVPAASATNIYGVSIIDIHDYASTTKAKTVRTIMGNDRNGSGEIRLQSGLWTSTSAINRIDISEVNLDNITSGSTFALYGIKGA